LLCNGFVKSSCFDTKQQTIRRVLMSNEQKTNPGLLVQQSVRHYAGTMA
jgi:hypothetical protein